MKKFKIQRVSGLALTVMLLITLVILGLFFFGGEASMDQRVVSDPALSQPLYTDAILYWNYILFVLGVVAIVIGVVYQFGSMFADSPKAALKSLIGIVALVLILVVTWAAGSGEPLVIPGYEGTENVPFWLKLTDMFLYTLYIEVGVMILLMLGFGIMKKIK